MTNVFEQWLKTRPPEIQKLGKEFPVGTKVTVPGQTKLWTLVGYAEGDVLLISPIDPLVDYKSSISQRQRVCAEHYR